MRCLLALLLLSTCGTLHGATDGLAELNQQRARKGLHPFMRDEGLTQAAMRCADVRAANRCEGHTQNDFSYLNGAQADAAGCAAATPEWGWLSCCMDDDYQYAGAAYAWSGGQRYMHLFVRGGNGGGSRSTNMRPAAMTNQRRFNFRRRR